MEKQLYDKRRRDRQTDRQTDREGDGVRKKQRVSHTDRPAGRQLRQTNGTTHRTNGTESDIYGHKLSVIIKHCVQVSDS